MATRVVPAQLRFLAIYNPALGDSDETFHRQIVFYYSTAARARARGSTQDAAAAREEEHEQLRQVGLAQGMVGFARSFAHGESVDSIETDKSRIVLHELEAGWWILATVDLTQLPVSDGGGGGVEYSGREVSPPALLVQQLVRAHGIFTLHHGWPLDQLLKKHGRAKFCSILHTYWAGFCAGWDVMLHGSPAVELLAGLKLAAGGELGVGVGEEDWGSSERDVLEDFARRTEGLVDVVVSRFGSRYEAEAPLTTTTPAPADTTPSPWLGCGAQVAPSDGVVFSGVGGLSRASLRDVAHWIESIYHNGDLAYGVRDNPTSDRRRRRRRDTNPARRKPEPESLPVPPPIVRADSNSNPTPPIPPPIIKAVETSLARASHAADNHGPPTTNSTEPPTMLASLADTDTWVKYMTLGYGTAWGAKKPLAPPEPVPHISPTPNADPAHAKRAAQVHAENTGYFLIGLKGDLADLDPDSDSDINSNARIPLRTVYVQAVNKPSTTSESDETPGEEAAPSWNAGVALEKSRLRPVVYIHRPFIYTFLFAHRTPALTLSTFYRSLHSFFAPLHASLDRNTSPTRVAQRLQAAQSHQTTTASATPNTNPIYDLVWDPRTLTLHTSLPNIPDPGHGTDHWSRLDALNVHSLLLTTLIATRRRKEDVERSSKTARGWWVVWMRLPPSSSPPPLPLSPPSSQPPSPPSEQDEGYNTRDLREAFLVRRARDADPTHATRGMASGMWNSMALGIGGQSPSQARAKNAGWGPKGLVDGIGIGIDARRYVDELLSLNR